MRLSRASSNNQQRFLAGFGAFVCAVLLVLAVPRFVASLYMLYPEAVFEQFRQSKQAIPGNVYDKSRDHLENARVWFETGQYWQIDAFLQLLRLRSTLGLTPAERQQLMRQAHSAITQGLRLSPVDPYAWFRLAAVEQMLGTEPRSLRDTLRLSIYAGRVEPDLLMPRLSFAYRFYDDSDDEMRRLLRGQVRLVWLFHPKELVIFAADHPNTLSWVNEALSTSPDDWLSFSSQLERYMQKNNWLRAKPN